MKTLFSRPTTDQVLQQLSNVIPAGLGNELLMLVVYGPHAKAAKSAAVADRRSPISILLVVKTLDVELLSQIAVAMRRIRGRERMSPMVLSLEELKSSIDVFPITFLDMQHDYRLLAGKDILGDLVVPAGHLRLRCEQELKNLVLRMQSIYLLQESHPRRLRVALRDNYRFFQRTVRAVFRLTGTEFATEEDFLSQVVGQLGLDEQVLERVDRFCKNTEQRGQAVVNLFVAFLLQVHQAAAFVDQLPDDVVVLDVDED